MGIREIIIDGTPMQAFVLDEILSHRQCSLLYSDRLVLLSDKSMDTNLHPIRVNEAEAIRRILIAYKKLDINLVSQVQGRIPYYDCNLSNLTNIRADVSQPYKDWLVMVLGMIERRRAYRETGGRVDNGYNCAMRRRLALRKEILDEINCHSNRLEIYVSRYDAFDKKKKKYVWG